MINPNQRAETKEIVEQILKLLQTLSGWSLEFARESRNKVALKIAESVINDQRYQSYIARNGPSWLLPLIDAEAAGLHL